MPDLTTTPNERTMVVLRAALEIVKEGWSHRATARDGKGTALERWDLPGAAAFCAAAAISKAASEIYGEPPLSCGPTGLRASAIFATLKITKAEDLLRQPGAVDEIIGLVTNVNDAAIMTAAMVQDRMRQAIHLIEGERR